MASVASPRHALPPLRATSSRTERRSVTVWYVAGALVAFAVQLFAASLLELHHDLYLLVYFTVTGTFLASFVAHTDLEWRGWLRTRTWWSVAVGGAGRRRRFAGLTLLLSMGITATYHLGYPQFRGTDPAQPMIGAAIATVPTALTGNPLGALVVHDAFHVAANVHVYRSATFLQPDLAGYAERGGGTAGLALAALWVVVAGTLIYVERRRLFPTQRMASR